LSLTEAKLYLRVTHTSEDALITSLITAARVYCETKTRRAFVTKTVTQQYRGFFDGVSPLVLAHAPIASVSSITYVDNDGATQTLSSAWYRLEDFVAAIREASPDFQRPGGDYDTWYIPRRGDEPISHRFRELGSSGRSTLALSRKRTAALVGRGGYGCG
jgi:hypothetical protein